MVHANRFLAAAIVFAALSAAPSSAHAWPLGHLFHLHPNAARAKDARITVQLYNKSGLVQQVKVGDRLYTLMPNGGLTITAPEGTEVFAVDKGFKHRAGDKLCAFTPDMNLETVVID